MTDRSVSSADPSPASVTRDTQAVWAGEHDSLVQGATQVPVVYSAAYGYPDVDAWLEVAQGKRAGHIYSRNTNPTTHAFEEKVRVLEGGEAATSFATGMAAISNSLFALLSPGDSVQFEPINASELERLRSAVAAGDYSVPCEVITA